MCGSTAHAVLRHLRQFVAKTATIHCTADSLCLGSSECWLCFACPNPPAAALSLVPPSSCGGSVPTAGSIATLGLAPLPDAAFTSPSACGGLLWWSELGAVAVPASLAVALLSAVLLAASCKDPLAAAPCKASPRSALPKASALGLPDARLQGSQPSQLPDLFSKGCEPSPVGHTMQSRTPNCLKQRGRKCRQYDHDRANGILSNALKNLLAAPFYPFMWCYHII